MPRSPTPSNPPPRLGLDLGGGLGLRAEIKPEARKAQKPLSPRKFQPGRKSQAATKLRARTDVTGAMPWDDTPDPTAPAGKKTKKGTR